MFRLKFSNIYTIRIYAFFIVFCKKKLLYGNSSPFFMINRKDYKIPFSLASIRH